MANNLSFRYKQMAMKWLTGKLETIPSVNYVAFEEEEKINNKLQQLMEGLYFPFGYDIEGIVQGKTNNNENIEYSVLFGNYADEYQTTNYGFIMILDNQYNPIQIIKEYSNGELIGNILGLNVGNDGLFYMVEIDNQDYVRLVLLNNILAKSPTAEEYQLVMRKTYRFPEQSHFDLSKVYMTKHPQDAKYLFVQFNNSQDYIYCTELSINVGSENEWNYYNKQMLNVDYEIHDILASWDSENKLKFILVGSYWNVNKRYVSYTYKEKDSDILNGFASDITSITYNINKEDEVNIQIIIKNFTTFYISYSFRYNNQLKYYLILSQYNDDYSQGNIRFVKVINSPISNNKGITLVKKDDNIFCYYVDLISYLGVIVNNEIYLSNMSDEPTYSQDDIYLVSVQKQFNLYTMYIQVGNYVYANKLVYIDEDNNSVYQDTTSMNPYYAKFYDDNDKLIFARTLYNKNISGQTTTSIIQVPNQFLNNVNISKEYLFGHTYLSLIMQDDTYSKNEYEEVYFNFANTWYIQNKNNPNNPILNPSGATRFNQSISQINDLNNCKCTKYRINYDNETTKIVNIPASDIILEENDEPFKYTYYLQVYVPNEKNILSIDLISEDEQTVFQTIINLNLTNGKLYTLTQDVYVL